jgi:hypothetical protein
MLRFFSVPLILAISMVIVSLVPVPKEEELYYPTQVGAKWVYQYSDGTELTSVITKVEVKDGSKVVSVSRAGKDGVPNHIFTRQVSSKGLFVIKVGDPPKSVNPPMCELRLPCKPGEKWTASPDDLNNPYFGVKYERKTHGWEDVSVPSGTYRAIRVEENRIFSPRVSWQYSTWYAPGVGLVKVISDEGDGHKRRIKKEGVLKSFTPGN